jgi:hypothetical protein
MPIVRLLTVLIVTAITSSAQAVCPYDSNCLDNPCGAGNPYSNQQIYVVPSR